MRFAVDAHAIGRHLTGNEVYVRSLLNAFGAHADDCEFVAYLSAEEASGFIPPGIQTRRVAANPFLRLGFDLPRRVRQDRPDLLHVQYTAPLACPVPIVVSVHDVSFLEHPEYFPRSRAWQFQQTVRRTVKRAARVLTGSEFSRSSILKVYGDLDEDKVVVVPNAAAPEFRPIPREAAMSGAARAFPHRRPVHPLGGGYSTAQEPDRADPRVCQAGPGVSAAETQPGAGGQRDLVRGPGARSGARIGRGRPDPVSLGSSPTAIFSTSTTPATFSCSRRSTRASACRCWRPWPADGRWRAPTPRRCPRWWTGRRSCSTPTRWTRSSARIADVLLDSELRARMERLGLQRAAHFSWQKTAQKTLGRFSRGGGNVGAAWRRHAPQP